MQQYDKANNQKQQLKQNKMKNKENEVENMDDSTNSAKMPVMCSADCYVADRSKKDWDAGDDLYRCKHCRRAIGVIHWFGTEAHSGCVADGIAP